MSWPARRSKMCSMIGVFTTGAKGLGTSPVNGKSLVPLPAARAIAFIRFSLSAKPYLVLYIPYRAHEHSTPALPLGQVRRTPEALHGLEDRGPRGRPARAGERGRPDPCHRDSPRTRHPR